MTVILGILVIISWIFAIELCIESRRIKNIALVTLLLASFWVMQAAIKRLDCGNVSVNKPDIGTILPWN